MQLRARTLISSMRTYQGILSSQGTLPPTALAPRTAPDPRVDPAAAAAAAAAVHQLPSVGQRGHSHRPPSFYDVQSTARHNAASGTSPKTTESELARPTQKPPVASYACAQRRGGRRGAARRIEVVKRAAAEVNVKGEARGPAGAAGRRGRQRPCSCSVNVLRGGPAHRTVRERVSSRSAVRGGHLCIL